MPKPSKGLGLKQTAKMARALTQDKSDRTIGFINKDVACIMFNFKFISIISSPSDVGRDAYAYAWRSALFTLNKVLRQPRRSSIIILCEDNFR